MVALLLLKGLSTFEYSLRDKATTYMDVLMEEFETKEKGLFSAIKNAAKEEDEISLLTIDLGASTSALKLIDVYENVTELQDTGFLEIKYKAVVEPFTVADFIWQDKSKVKHTLKRVDPDEKGFVVLKSDLISLSHFSDLKIALDKQESKALMLQDSSNVDKHLLLGFIYIDYLKVVAKIEQTPLF